METRTFLLIVLLAGIIIYVYSNDSIEPYAAYPDAYKYPNSYPGLGFNPYVYPLPLLSVSERYGFVSDASPYLIDRQFVYPWYY